MRYSWLLAVAALAACSENRSGDGPGAPPSTTEAVAQSDAAAMAAAVESVRASPGPPACNQRGEQTGLDILGVRLGMDAASARRLLECEGYSVRVQTKRPLSDGSSAVSEMTGQRNEDRFDLRLAGLPGRERVVGMLRHVRYSTAGTEPSVDALRRSLLEKYGSFEPLYRGDRGKPILHGVRLASFDGEPGINGAELDCASDVAEQGGRLYYPRPECGELVAIYITPKGSNTGLVEKLTVEITDGSMAAGLDREYVRFAERDQARAAEREVSDAASRTPDL